MCVFVILLQAEQLPHQDGHDSDVWILIGGRGWYAVPQLVRPPNRWVSVLGKD